MTVWGKDVTWMMVSPWIGRIGSRLLPAVGFNQKRQSTHHGKLSLVKPLISLDFSIQESSFPSWVVGREESRWLISKNYWTCISIKPEYSNTNCPSKTGVDPMRDPRSERRLSLDSTICSKCSRPIPMKEDKALQCHCGFVVWWRSWVIWSCAITVPQQYMRGMHAQGVTKCILKIQLRIVSLVDSFVGNHPVSIWKERPHQRKGNWQIETVSRSKTCALFNTTWCMWLACHRSSQTNGFSANQNCSANTGQSERSLFAIAGSHTKRGKVIARSRFDELNM